MPAILGFWNLDVDFVDDTTWWVGIDSVNSRASEFFVTSDAGETWSHHVHGPGGGIIEIFSFDATTAWLRTVEGVVFSTEDGGETWDPLVANF
ncbi:MAG: hypothetical protein ACR2ME_00875 [Acidimicrobiia bacterium]